MDTKQNEHIRPKVNTNFQKPANKGLGKGLGALIRAGLEKDEEGHIVTQKKQNEDIEFDKNGQTLIDINKIVRNPYQPRKEFDEEALEELASSIKQHGVITAITVRKALNGYELISGERRLRASIKAGLTKIPALILDVRTNTEMLEIAIIENVQRENLNPVEVAYAYQKLIEECQLTQEQVAVRMGKNRSTITNFLRLLRLPEKVKNFVRDDKLSFGHAKVLLSIEDEAVLLKVANEIIEKSLSVRDTENLIKNLDNFLNPPAEPFVLAEDTTLPVNNEAENETIESKTITGETKTKPKIQDPNILHLEDKLRLQFGTEVKIKTKTGESGSIELEFYSKDDFERILDLFKLT